MMNENITGLIFFSVCGLYILYEIVNQVIREAKLSSQYRWEERRKRSRESVERFLESATGSHVKGRL